MPLPSLQPSPCASMFSSSLLEEVDEAQAQDAMHDGEHDRA